MDAMQPRQEDSTTIPAQVLQTIEINRNRLLDILTSTIEAAFCLDRNPKKAENDGKTNAIVFMFQSKTVPSMTVGQYMRRLEKYTGASGEAFVMSMIHLARIASIPNFPINLLTIHRLILTSLLISVKYFDDTFLNNARYARVGGVTTKELNMLEVEFCFLIDFALYVSPQEYVQVLNQLVTNNAATQISGQTHSNPLILLNCIPPRNRDVKPRPPLDPDGKASKVDSKLDSKIHPNLNPDKKIDSKIDGNTVCDTNKSLPQPPAQIADKGSSIGADPGCVEAYLRGLQREQLLMLLYSGAEPRENILTALANLDKCSHNAPAPNLLSTMPLPSAPSAESMPLPAQSNMPVPCATPTESTKPNGAIQFSSTIPSHVCRRDGAAGHTVAVGGLASQFCANGVAVGKQSLQSATRSQSCICS